MICYFIALNTYHASAINFTYPPFNWKKILFPQKPQDKFIAFLVVCFYDFLTSKLSTPPFLTITPLQTLKFCVFFIYLWLFCVCLCSVVFNIWCSKWLFLWHWTVPTILIKMPSNMEKWRIFVESLKITWKCHFIHRILWHLRKDVLVPSCVQCNIF